MKRLLAIGDSNTWGFDPRSYGGDRYAPDVRWTGRLSGWEVVNDGINGRRIPVPSEYSDTLRLKPEAFDAVAVMLGTNDVLQGMTPEAAADAMDAFLGFLSPAVGHSKLLLIAPPPFQYGDWVTEERQIKGSRKLPDVYAALAARLGIGFADAGEWNVALTFDGVHFTPEGHAAFAKGLRSVLDAL